MIEQFSRLTQQEAQLLIKAPAMVSALAATTGNEVNERAKADAIKLAHLKTFTADPLLLPYYEAVEQSFAGNLELTLKKYAPFDDKQRDLLRNELAALTGILAKLDDAYAAKLQHSLAKYAKHVKRAEHVVLEDFLLPFKLPGITD